MWLTRINTETRFGTDVSLKTNSMSIATQSSRPAIPSILGDFNSLRRSLAIRNRSTRHDPIALERSVHRDF